MAAYPASELLMDVMLTGVCERIGDHDSWLTRAHMLRDEFGGRYGL
jgi:hypothetical protein